MTSTFRSLSVLAGLEALPTFLAPTVFRSPLSISRKAQFSTSIPKLSRKTRDASRNRGVSALRRTGLRHPVEMSKEPLPMPMLDPERRTKIKVSEKHGLWAFFGKEKRPLNVPEVDAAHGRSWVVEELRHKSFEDLQCLWWVCVKERNRIATQEYERQRSKIGYGEYEAKERLRSVRGTQRAIKHALTERWYAYQEARKIAKDDPEVDLRRTIDGQSYSPDNFEDDLSWKDGREDFIDEKILPGTISRPSRRSPKEQPRPAATTS